MGIFDFLKKNKKKDDNNLKESEIDKLVAGELDIKANEIKKTGKQVEDSQHTNNKLNAFKATSIVIDKTSSGVPILRIEISNTMRIDDFKGYLFVLDIYDIANNEKIDSYGFGSTFKETKVLNGYNSLFSKKNYSLEPIVNENKHIQNLLTTATLPSDNLKQFNLRTEFIVKELELGDGKLDIKTDEKNNVEKDIPKNHIELFPEIKSIFNENIDKNTEVFFPVCSINLGVINEEWENEKIHLIQFHEDPYNNETAKYFNDYCKDNMISFSLEKGKYKFNTDFGYFDLTDDWKEYYEETKVSYNKSKTEYKENGKTFNLENLTIGGEPEWWQSDETPLDPDGNPMTFVTELETYGFCPDSCDKKIFMFYSHKHKLVVELYQIT